MKHRLLFTLILLLPFFEKTFAQTFQKTASTLLPAPDRQDTKHAATADGGQIWVGTVESAGNKDILVTKIKPDGSVQWSNRYGGTGTEFAGSVVQLGDGNYMVSGSSNSFSTNYQALLLKLTSAGYISFAKTYQADAAFHHASFVRQISDGFLVGGTNNFDGSIGAQENLGRVFGFKTDLSGNLMWMRSWDTGRQRADITEAHATNDTSYVFLGSSGHNRDYMGVLLIKTETDGDLKWSKVIRSTTGCNTTNCWSASNLGIMLNANGMVVNADKSYTIAGGILQGNNPLDWNWTYTLKRGYILQINQNGGIVYSNAVNLTGATASDSHEYFDIAKNADGSYILGGSFKGEKALLAKFSATGSPSFVKSYSSLADSKFASVGVYSDGKLSAFGYRGGEFAAVKVNSDGTNGTCAGNETASTVAYPVESINLTLVASTTGIAATRTLSLTQICQTENNFCSGTLTAITPVAVQLGSADTTVCIGASWVVNLSNMGYDSAVWSNGTNALIFSSNTAGTYSVTVYRGGCTATDTKTLLYAACPCELTTKGTEFWVGFLEAFTNTGGKTLSLTATSDMNATGEVFYGLSVTPAFTFNVVAGTSTTVTIANAMEALGSESIEDKGIRVVTTNPVNLYALSYTQFSSDATVLYPIETLGTDYFVTTYTQNTVARSSQRRNSEFMVVATEDNTLVTITPTKVTTGLRPANVPFTVTLNRGQSYEVQSGNITGSPIAPPVMPTGQGDLTGSRVQSDKKVAVFGGNYRTLVPDINTCCWDNLYQQTPPVRTLGKEFVTVPYMSRSWDIFRVLAVENGTSINISGIGAITLNSGQWYEFNTNGSNTPRLITSDKSISVTQFSTSRDTDGAAADPFMITLNPAAQTLSNITFVAFNSTVIDNYYLNVLCKTTTAPFVVLDGTNIAGSFATVPANPTYSYARLNITAGTHNINTGTNVDGVIGYVYGYGNAESYGYSVGGNMQTVLDIGPPGIGGDTTLCSGTTLTLTTTSTDFVTYVWSTGETTPNIDITESGTYWIRGVDIVGCEKRDSLNVIFVAPPADIKHLGVSVDTIRYCDVDGAQILDGQHPAYTLVDYEWTILGSPTVLSTSNTLSANIFSDTTTYLLTVTDLSTPLNCVIYDTVTAVFFPTPQVTTGGSFVSDTIRWCNYDGPQVIAAGNDPNNFNVTYTWVNLNTGLVISTDREITVADYSDTVRYEVTMLDASNSIPCGAKDTITVIFHPAPVADITQNGISAALYEFCITDGDQDLSGWHATHIPAGRMLYKWYKNSDYSTVIGTSETLTVSSTVPTALYTVVVYDGIDTTFCQTADSVTVTFNPSPHAEIKHGSSAAADVLYFCNSEGAQTLSGIHSSHGSGIDYQWYNANAPDALILVGSSGTFNATGFSDSVKYLLVVTNTAQPTDCQSFDSVKVVFTEDPTVDILFNGNSVDFASYCLSDGLSVLTAVSSIATVSYQWLKVGSGPITGANTPNLTVATSGVYQVLVTDISRPSLCTASDEITVEVTPNPPTNLPDSTIVCTTMGTLNITASGMNYAWSGPLGFTASTQSIDIFPGEGGWYFVDITDPATSCFSRDSSYVMFSTPANAAITYDLVAPLCEGTPLVISAFDPEHINDGGVTYLWSTGANTPSISVAESGTYSVLIKRNFGGCESSASVTLTFNPAPNINLPDVVYYCTPSDEIGVTLSPAYTYTWEGPGITGTFIGQVLTVTESGTYTLTALDLTTGCSASKAIEVLPQAQPVSGLPDSVLVCQNALPAALNARDFSHGSHITYTWFASSDLSTPISTDSILSTSLEDFYVVKISNPYSTCFTLDTVKLSIVPNPDVSIGGYDGPHCSRGDTLYALVTNLTGMTLKWTGPGISGPDNGLSLIANTSGVYTLTVTDNNTSAACATSKSIVVWVNTRPIININTAATYIICEGDKQILNAYHPTHSPSYTYKWTDLRTNKVLSTEVQFELSAELYTTLSYEPFLIELTVRDNATNCESRETIKAQFKRRTNVKILQPSKTEICLGEELLLTADGATNYLWSTGDKTRDFTWKPDSAGVYTISVEGHYDNGCNATFAEITLKVNPLPYVNLPDSIRVCENEIIHLEGFHFSHPNGALYSWKNLNDGSILSTEAFFKMASSSIANATNDTVRIELTVTDVLTGCFSTDVITVKFDRAPTVKIKSSDADNKICFGESVILTAQGGTNYLWNTGETTPEITVQPNRYGNVIYSVKVFYPNNCQPATDSVSLTVFRAPRVRAHTTDEVNICYGEKITLVPSGALTYKWEHDPTLSGNISVQPDISTTYYVIGTNENGCSARAAVRINVTPVIDLPPSMLFCTGETAVIGAVSPVPATYFWTPGGEKTPTIVVEEEGTYTVTVTVENCQYSKSVLVEFLKTPRVYLVKDTTLCFENAADNFEPQIIPILPKILNKTADATYITVWRDEKEEIIGTSDTLFVTRPGTYSLKVMALFKDKLCGENVNLTTKVNELCPPRIFVPDGFTPNGDGLNDRFKVFGRHVFEFKMQVYNRWNELVYEIEADKIEDITEEAWWDGTYRGALAPDGQYVWVMTYSTETDKEREKIRTEGAFVIVR